VVCPTHPDSQRHASFVAAAAHAGRQPDAHMTAIALIGWHLCVRAGGIRWTPNMRWIVALLSTAASLPDTSRVRLVLFDFWYRAAARLSRDFGLACGVQAVGPCSYWALPSSWRH